MSAVHSQTKTPLGRIRDAALLRSYAAPFLWLAMTPLVTVPLSAVLYRYDVFAPQYAGCTDWYYNVIDGSYGGEFLRRFPFFPFYDCGEHPEGATLLAFTLPGLLNLGPLLWAVLSPVPTTRLAGIVAGSLGIFRLVLPTILLEINKSNVVSGYSDETSAQFDRYVYGMAGTIYIVGALAWFGCLVAWMVFTAMVEFGVIEPSSEQEKLAQLPPPRSR